MNAALRRGHFQELKEFNGGCGEAAGLADFGVNGRVQATICLVLPMDISSEQWAELQQTLIAIGRKLSMDA